MLSQNALVVVADGHGAVFYRNAARVGVELAHAGQMHPGDLADGTGSGPLPGEQSAWEEDEATFARQVVRRLNAIVLKHEAEQVVIIADPQTLGQMRGSYHGELEKRILREIPKTMTWATPAEIGLALA